MTPPNSRRCSAGRRRSCPPKCAVRSARRRSRRRLAISARYRALSAGYRAEITRELGDVDRMRERGAPRHQLGRHRTAHLDAVCLGRLLQAFANSRIDQHQRGENAGGELLAAQDTAVVHLAGMRRSSGPSWSCCLATAAAPSAPRPRGIEEQPASGKPRHRQLADLFVDGIREQIADELRVRMSVTSDQSTSSPSNSTDCAQRDAAEVVEQPNNTTHRFRRADHIATTSPMLNDHRSSAGQDFGRTLFRRVCGVGVFMPTSQPVARRRAARAWGSSRPRSSRRPDRPREYGRG